MWLESYEWTYFDFFIINNNCFDHKIDSNCSALARRKHTLCKTTHQTCFTCKWIHILNTYEVWRKISLSRWSNFQWHEASCVKAYFLFPLTGIAPWNCKIVQFRSFTYQHRHFRLTRLWIKICSPPLHICNNKKYSKSISHHSKYF